MWTQSVTFHIKMQWKSWAIYLVCVIVMCRYLSYIAENPSCSPSLFWVGHSYYYLIYWPFIGKCLSIEILRGCLFVLPAFCASNQPILLRFKWATSKLHLWPQTWPGISMLSDGSQKNISGHAVYSIDYSPSFLITACFIHPATGKLQM